MYAVIELGGKQYKVATGDELIVDRLELDEGKSLFESRVADDIVQGTNIFQKALIDIIIGGKTHVNTPIW